MPAPKSSINEVIQPPNKLQSINYQLLIGPEGDFTKDEINLALENGFLPVSLGDTRLRTETAGIAGAVLLTNLR